jgi:hypothetical protein
MPGLELPSTHSVAMSFSPALRPVTPARRLNQANGDILQTNSLIVRLFFKFIEFIAYRVLTLNLG